jgi:ABC-type uncharacterized transport system permease subunit
VSSPDLIHLAAVGLTAAAGLGYLLAARAQWRRLRDQDAADDSRWWWIAFAAQSIALLVSLLDQGHRSFAYGALAAWAGVAATLFASRFVSAPGRLIFALPLGAVALLVAVAGTASLGAPPEDGAGSWISRVHAGFMAAHLAGLVVAGAAGGLYVVASARLKSADPRATRLPTLPVLERLLERGLVWGTALLIGGLATGGAAIRVSLTFRLLHPTALLGLVEVGLLVVVLAMHRTRNLSRRALALAAIACLAIALLGTISQIVIAHG